MAVRQTKKKAAPKRPPGRKNPARKRRTSRNANGIFSLKRIFAALVLMGILIFSIGVAGYVIFFRTVLA